MVARRTSSGAGFVHGTHTGGISGAVKGMDMYAKLPRELAEGSITGGIISGVMVRRGLTGRACYVVLLTSCSSLFDPCRSPRYYFIFLSSSLFTHQR